MSDVIHGTLHDQEKTSCIVLKTYDRDGMWNLLAEARAYKSLQDLQGTEVAAQFGILATSHWGWVGLLIEDAGVPLGCGGKWDVEPADR